MSVAPHRWSFGHLAGAALAAVLLGCALPFGWPPLLAQRPVPAAPVPTLGGI